MQKLMEYKIISGRTVEIRRTWMNVRSGSQPKKRGTRIAGNSSARKIRANEVEAIKNLARILNANIEDGWLIVSLNYDNLHLPENYADLELSSKKFIRTFRTAFKKATGRNPRFILVNANWSPEKDKPARLHHHLVIEPCSLDLLAACWKYGGIATEATDGREDHTALAVYLVGNTHGLDRNTNRWRTSRGNLNKPIYTEPEEVCGDVEDITVLPTARQTAFERLDDECGRAVSAYVRCVLPEKPKIRGSMIVLPRKQRKGGKT